MQLFCRPDVQLLLQVQYLWMSLYVTHVLIGPSYSGIYKFVEFKLYFDDVRLALSHFSGSSSFNRFLKNDNFNYLLTQHAYYAILPSFACVFFLFPTTLWEWKSHNENKSVFIHWSGATWLAKNKSIMKISHSDVTFSIFHNWNILLAQDCWESTRDTNQ